MPNSAALMTTAASIGTLPELLEEMAGTGSLVRVREQKRLPLALVDSRHIVDNRHIRVPLASMRVRNWWL